MVNSGSLDSEGPAPAPERRPPPADSGGSGEGAHSPSHPPRPPPPDTALPGLRDAVGPTPTQTQFNAADAADALCCSLQPPADDPAKPKQQRKLLCLYCERSFAGATLRHKHVERCHSARQSRRASSRRPHSTQQLAATPCIYCDRLAGAEHTLRQLFEHLALAHAQRYHACVPCEDRFLSAAALAEHQAVHHAAPAPAAARQITRNVSVLIEKDVAIAAAAAAAAAVSSNDSASPHLPVHAASRSSPISSSNGGGNSASGRCADDKCATDGDLSDGSARVRVKKEPTHQDDVSAEHKPSKDALEKTQREYGQKETPDKVKRETSATKTTRSKVKASDQRSERGTPSPSSPHDPKKNQNLRQLRSKKMTVKASKISQKRMSKRLQAKINETQKKRRTRTGEKAAAKPELIGGAKPGEKASKAGAASQNPYPEFDSFYRVKKITDHSIDNLKISSLKFDDVFDKAFFNRIQCNIQENLLHHIDGKLFKNEESESRISNFEKVSGVAPEAPNASAESYGCELSLNAVTPVASLLTSVHFGEDLESQIEYGSKPSKKKLGSSRQDEVHYKYFTRRKYQASIMEQKENRDLSKLDMWTQLVIKSRQQKMADDKKTAKEMLEYTSGLEYKTRLKREELNRILDRRGPFEDLKEEATKKAALDKLNSDSDDRVSEEAFTDVQDILNDLLAKVFNVVNADLSDDGVTASGVSHIEGNTTITSATAATSAQKCLGGTATGFFLQKSGSSSSCNVEERAELPGYLKLRRSSSLPSEGEIDRSDRIALICSSQETEYDEVAPRRARAKNEAVELTGEWARARIYVCAACGKKVANMRRLLEHKNAQHQYVWTQHYEFVGTQSELYRHLSIPGLGKVGAVEAGGRGRGGWRRSEARVCGKCGRRCNALADLHRHVLECAGDWTWMLARKKCKYRPFGTKSRRKRRGLVKRIRVQKSDNGAERKYKKRYDGPRQRPSDADTIQRMLANLPAKRATRKIMSLKDGYQRNHQPHISIVPQNKMKCGKIIVRNSSNIRNANMANAGKDSGASGGNKPISNPSGSSVNKNQKANHRNDRRTLKNLNKVLASRILDTNASLLVKRKLKTLSNRRTTRQDISKPSSESTKKESPKAEDKATKSAVKKTSPKSGKAKADGGEKEDVKAKKNSKVDKSDKVSDGTNSDTATKKSNKVLPNKLSLKSFFPVKKKKAAASAEQKSPKSAKTSDAANENTSNDKKTNQDKTKTSKDKNKSDEKLVKKAKSQSFGSLVRSLSLRKRKLLRMEEKKTDKSEATSNTTSVEQEKTNKKRKLKQTIKKVVEKVKKVKTAKTGETSKTKSDSSRSPTGDNQRPTGPFLEAGNVEESPPIEKIVIPSTSEKSESTADISVLAPIVISVSAASEVPQTSKTIFNLQSNNEKNLQAKGELNFDTQNLQPDAAKSQSLSPNAATQNASLNPAGTSAVSPNMKGKIKRPAKRLNDCIAMLTNKLQQQQQQQQVSATPSIFNLMPPTNQQQQPSLFSAIPDPMPVQEECVALDLSMKNKPREPERDLLRIPMTSQCMPKSYSYNSIDRIIQEVVDNKFALPPHFPILREPLKVPSNDDMLRKWNSVDDIIQRVVENKCDPKYDLPTSKIPKTCSWNCVNETIDYVASGKDLEEARMRLAFSDTSLTIKDIVKVPNVPKPNRRKSLTLTPMPPTPIDISSLIAGVTLPPLPPNLIVTLSDPIKDLVSVPLPVNFNILNIPLASVMAPVLNAETIAKNSKKRDDKPTKPRVRKILKSKILSKTDNANEIQSNVDNSSNIPKKMTTFLETDLDNIMNVKEVDNVSKDIPLTVAENLLPKLEGKEISDTQVIPVMVEENEPIQLENKVVTVEARPVDETKLSIEKALKSDSEDELPLAALKTDKKPDTIQETTPKPMENITITDLLNSSRSEDLNEALKAESFTQISNEILEKKVLKKSLKKRNRPGVNMRPVFKIKAFRKPLRKPSVDDILATIERVINGVDEHEEVAPIDEDETTEPNSESQNLNSLPDEVDSEPNQIIDTKSQTDKEKENIPDQPSDTTSSDTMCNQNITEEEPSSEETEIVENKLTEVVSNIPQPELKVSPKRTKKRKAMFGVIRTRIPASKRRAAKNKKRLANSASDVSLEMKMIPVDLETEQQFGPSTGQEKLSVSNNAEIQEENMALCDIPKEEKGTVIPQIISHDPNTCVNVCDLSPLKIDTPETSLDKVPRGKQKKQNKSTTASKLQDSVEHSIDASKVAEIDSIPSFTELDQSSNDNAASPALAKLEEKTGRTKARRKCTLNSISSLQHKSDSVKETPEVKSKYEVTDTDLLVPERTETNLTEPPNLNLDENAKNVDITSTMEVVENIGRSSRRKSKARVSKKRVSSLDMIPVVSNAKAENNSGVDLFALCDLEKVPKNQDISITSECKTQSLDENQIAVATTLSGVVNAPQEAEISDNVQTNKEDIPVHKNDKVPETAFKEGALETTKSETINECLKITHASKSLSNAAHIVDSTEKSVKSQHKKRTLDKVVNYLLASTTLLDTPRIEVLAKDVPTTTRDNDNSLAIEDCAQDSSNKKSSETCQTDSDTKVLQIEDDVAKVDDVNNIPELPNIALISEENNKIQKSTKRQSKKRTPVKIQSDSICSSSNIADEALKVDISHDAAVQNPEKLFRHHSRKRTPSKITTCSSTNNLNIEDTEVGNVTNASKVPTLPDAEMNLVVDLPNPTTTLLSTEVTQDIEKSIKRLPKKKTSQKGKTKALDITDDTVKMDIDTDPSKKDDTLSDAEIPQNDAVNLQSEKQAVTEVQKDLTDNCIEKDDKVEPTIQDDHIDEMIVEDLTEDRKSVNRQSRRQTSYKLKADTSKSVDVEPSTTSTTGKDTVMDSCKEDKLIDEVSISIDITENEEKPQPVGKSRRSRSKKITPPVLQSEHDMSKITAETSVKDIPDGSVINILDDKIPELMDRSENKIPLNLDVTEKTIPTEMQNDVDITSLEAVINVPTEALTEKSILGPSESKRKSQRSEKNRSRKRTPHKKQVDNQNLVDAIADTDNDTIENVELDKVKENSDIKASDAVTEILNAVADPVQEDNDDTTDVIDGKALISAEVVKDNKKSKRPKSKKRTSEKSKIENKGENEVLSDTSKVDVLIIEPTLETEKSTKRRSRRRTPEQRQTNLECSGLSITGDSSKIDVNESSKADISSQPISPTKEVIDNTDDKTEIASKPEVLPEAVVSSKEIIQSDDKPAQGQESYSPINVLPAKTEATVMDVEVSAAFSDSKAIAAESAEYSKTSVEPLTKEQVPEKIPDILDIDLSNVTESAETSVSSQIQLSSETIILPKVSPQPKKKKSKSKKKSSQKKVATSGTGDSKTDTVTETESDTLAVKSLANTDVEVEKETVSNIIKEASEETEQPIHEPSVENTMLLTEGFEAPELLTIKTAETSKNKSKKSNSKKRSVQDSNKVIKETSAEAMDVSRVSTEPANTENSTDKYVEASMFNDASNLIENKTRRRIPVRRLIDEISSALDATSGNRKGQVTGDIEVEVEKRTTSRLTRQTVIKRANLFDKDNNVQENSDLGDSLETPKVDNHVSNLEETDEVALKIKSKRCIVKPNTVSESESQSDKEDNLDTQKISVKEDNSENSNSKKSTSLPKSSFIGSESNLICKLPLISCEDGKFRENIYKHNIEQLSMHSENVSVSIETPAEVLKAEEPIAAQIAVRSSKTLTQKVDSPVELQQLAEISKEVASNKDNVKFPDHNVKDRSDLERSSEVKEVEIKESHENKMVKKSVKKSKSDKKSAKKKKDGSIQRNTVQAQDTANTNQVSSASKLDKDALVSDEVIIATGDKDKPVKPQKITLKPPTLNFLLPPVQLTSVFTSSPGSCFGGFSFSKPAVDTDLTKEISHMLPTQEGIKFGSINETKLKSDVAHTDTNITNDATIEKSSKESCAEDTVDINVANDDHPPNQLDVLSAADTVQLSKTPEKTDELKAPKITLNLKEVLSKKSSNKKKKSKKESKIKTSTPDNSFSEKGVNELNSVDLTQLDVSNIQALVEGGESIERKVAEDGVSNKVDKLVEPDKKISKSRRKESKATQDVIELESEILKKTTRSRLDVSLTDKEKILSAEDSLPPVEKSGKVADYDVSVSSDLRILGKTSEIATENSTNTSSDFEFNESKSEDIANQPEISKDLAADVVPVDETATIPIATPENISKEVSKVQSSSHKTSRKSTKRNTSTKKSKTTRTSSLDTLTKLIHDSIEKLGEGSLDNTSQQEDIDTTIKRSKSSSSIFPAKSNEQNNAQIESSSDKAVKHKSPKRKSRKPTKSTVMSEEIIYVSKQSEATVSYSKSEEKLPTSSYDSENTPNKTAPAFRDEFALLAELSGENLEDISAVHGSDLVAQKPDDEKSADTQIKNTTESQEKVDLVTNKKSKEKVKKTSKRESSVKQIDDSPCQVLETELTAETSKSISEVSDTKSAVAQVKRKSKKALQEQKDLIKRQSDKPSNEQDQTDSVSDSVYTFSDDDLGVSVKKQKKNKKTSKESTKKSIDPTVESDVSAKGILLCKPSNDSIEGTMKIKLKKTHNKKLSLVIKSNDHHTSKFNDAIEQVNYVSSTVIENEPMSPPKICLKITKDPIHNLVTVESNIKEAPPKETVPKADTRFELSPPKLILKNVDQKYLENKDAVPKVAEIKVKPSSQLTKKHHAKPLISDLSSENEESSSNEMSVDTTLTQTRQGWGLGQFISEPSTDDTSEADTTDIFAKPKLKRKTKTQTKCRVSQKNLSEPTLHAENTSETGPQLSAEDNVLTASELLDSNCTDTERTMPILLPEYDEPEIPSSEPSADEISETDIKMDYIRQRSNRKAKIIANSIIQKDSIFDKPPLITSIDSLQNHTVDAVSESQHEKETVTNLKDISPESKKFRESDLSTDETSESDSGLFVKPKPKKKLKAKTNRKKSKSLQQTTLETEAIEIGETSVSEVMPDIDVADVFVNTFTKDPNLIQSSQSDISTDEVSENEIKSVFVKPPSKKKSRASAKKKSKKKTVELANFDTKETLNMDISDNATSDLADRHLDITTNKPKVLIAEPKLVVPDTCMNEHADSDSLFLRKGTDKHKNVHLEKSEKKSANLTEEATNVIKSQELEQSLQVSSTGNITMIDNKIDSDNLRKPQIDHIESEDAMKDATSEHRNKKSANSRSNNESDVTKYLQSLEDATDLEALGILGSRRRSSRVLQKEVNTVNDKTQSLEVEQFGENELSEFTTCSRSKRKSKIAAEQRLQQLKAAENVPLDEEDDEEKEEDIIQNNIADEICQHENANNDLQGVEIEDESNKDQPSEEIVKQPLQKNVSENTENITLPLIGTNDTKYISPNKLIMTDSKISHIVETSSLADKIPVSISKPSNDKLFKSLSYESDNYTIPPSNNTEGLSLAEKVAMAIRESNKKLFAQTSEKEVVSDKEPNDTADHLIKKVEVQTNKPDTPVASDVSEVLTEDSTSRSKRKSKLAANKRLQELNYLDNDDLDECLNKSVPNILNEDRNTNKADKKSIVKDIPQILESYNKKELADNTDLEGSAKNATIFSNENFVETSDSRDTDMLEDLVQFSEKDEDQEKECLPPNTKNKSEPPIFEDLIERSCRPESFTDNYSEDSFDDFVKPKIKRRTTSSGSKRTSKKIDLDNDGFSSKQSPELETGPQAEIIENNIDSIHDDLVEMEIMKLKMKNKNKVSKHKKWDIEEFISKSNTSNGRKSHRKAKTKALEHILDEALSELSASNQNSDLLSRKKSESDCLPFEPEENLIRMENEARMANNNIEMASVPGRVDSSFEEDSLHSINFQETAQFDDSQSIEISDDDVEFIENISDPDLGKTVSLEMEVQPDSSSDKPCLRTRNRSKSITVDNIDLDANIEGSQEVRRSKRATRKIGSYNENEIANALIEEQFETPKKDKKKDIQVVEPSEQDMKLDPVPMVLEDIPEPGIIIENLPRLGSLQPKECFLGQNKNEKDDKVQSKLNSDELFDLLKKSTNDNPEFQKSHNSYVPNFDEISDFSSDSNNFDNVFEDILEIEDNLDESGKENRSDDLDADIFEFSRSSHYRTGRTSGTPIIRSSETPVITNDVSIPSIEISTDKEIINDDITKNTDKPSVINFEVLKDVAKTSIIKNVEPQDTNEKVISESKKEESDNALISTDFSESSTDKFNSKSKNSSKKSRGSRNLTNLFCDICNKSFRRSDNLVKHKRTLTHISKLSELEAQEALKKAPASDENQQAQEKNDSNISILSNGLPEDINPEDNTFNVDNSSIISGNKAFAEEDNTFPQEDNALENSKSQDDENISITNILSGEKSDLPVTDSSLITANFAVDTENRSLKLADIINDVLNKPVLERSNGNNFSDIILQNSSDVHPEYRRYKSLGERKSFESEQTENVSSTLNIDPPSFLEISDNTERVEKQITLLQNIIEKSGTTLNYTEEISVSSNQSIIDLARDSPSLSVGSSRQDDSNNLTFCSSNKMATNDDSFIKPSHYEEISEDSAQHRSYDDQKARKVLNRDEELFLECCSLWKSGSEVSNYSKKSHKLSVANSQEMKVADEPEWMENKQLAQKRVYEDNYSDNSRIPTPLGDSYNDEMSNSNTISSNWNSNKKEELEASNRAVLQGEVAQAEGDRSFVFREDSGSAKSEDKASRFAAVSNAFKTISDKIVEKFMPRTDEEKEIPLDSCIEKESEDTIENDGKKFVTKGAKKEFEGLKVSIPTDELNLSEVLNISPTAKIIDNKLDKPEPEPEPAKDQQNKDEIIVKEDFVTPHVAAPKIVKKSKFSKARLQHGNKFGFKMTKKRTPTKSLKRKRQAVPRKSDNSKVVDIYDFEETQDNSDLFTKPDFRSFRCKQTEDAVKAKDTNAESDNDSHGGKAKSVSSVSSMSSIPPKKAKTKLVTKKKCMIMGRIFRNAVKSKVEEDIRDIPTIDNAELVTNYVMNCQEVSVEEKVIEREPTQTFDNILDTQKEMLPPPIKEPSPEKNKADGKLTNKKKNTKLMKSRKRNRANSDSTDDEFSLNKNTKKRTNRKNPKAEDNTINLEQELKECIGVASRKSQRKCTSGKQNVLVEYWSSDDSSFEAMLESQRIIPIEEREPVKEPEAVPEEVPPPINTVPVEQETIEIVQPVEAPVEPEEPVKGQDEPQELPEVPPEPPKEMQAVPRQQPKPKKSKSTDRKLAKRPRTDGEVRKAATAEGETLAASRRKRAAADPLYHWSSSSEDESQDLIEVKPLRDEIDDDEDRPVQHGWIVGDSPKKLVTMLAQAKGKKVDADCVKEQGKKRAASTNS